jgi:predicted DNA-binding transcriptional regulator AlpA
MTGPAVDSLVKARAVCEALGGISRRTLYVYVKTGKFPRPDRAAQLRGEADLWKASTLREGIEIFTNGQSVPLAAAKTSTAPTVRPTKPRKESAIKVTARRR